MMAKVRLTRKVKLGMVTYPPGTCIIVARDVEKRLLASGRAELHDFTTHSERMAMDATRDRVVEQALSAADTVKMIRSCDDLDTLYALTSDDRKTVVVAAMNRIEGLTARNDENEE